VKLLPAPVVHADLAALVALAVTDEHGAAPLVEVTFGEPKRLTDPPAVSGAGTTSSRSAV
jgi:hypothetical protein